MVDVDAAVHALRVAYDADRPSLLRHAVRDLRKTGDGPSADALRGTIGRQQRGVLGFQFVEPRQECIKLGIGNFRRGL